MTRQNASTGQYENAITTHSKQSVHPFQNEASISREAHFIAPTRHDSSTRACIVSSLIVIFVSCRLSSDFLMKSMLNSWPDMLLMTSEISTRMLMSRHHHALRLKEGDFQLSAVLSAQGGKYQHAHADVAVLCLPSA